MKKSTADKGSQPNVPANCQVCPIRHLTVCEPLQDKDLGIVENFKIGDFVLPAGSQLYRQGETGSRLYNLLDGWVVLHQVLRSGSHQILDFALPGRFLGYRPDLDGPSAHTAECLTDVSVCVFPQQHFHALVERHPAIAIRLSRLVARDLAAAQDHLTNIGSRSAQARIAHLLLDLCARLRRFDLVPCGQAMEIPLTQNHIADALGCTNAYVSQMLKQLRKRCLLSFENGRLQILDPEGLAEFADVGAPSMD
jgi:CRP-like cAMP-binding protein